MSRVLVPLANGFEEIEAVTVVDVLRRGGIEVVTASIHATDDVRGAHGMRLRADALFADVADGDFDAIVLPGGGEGTENLRACEALLARLVRQRDERRLVCAICAAPTILCTAGVLDSETHVTCYPSCADQLDRRSADVPVVADGNVVTGQAPGAAMLFALVVLQTLEGPVVASRVARGLVTDVLD